jgi:hypothetical protein
MVDIKGPVQPTSGDELRAQLDEWRDHMFPPKLVLIAAGPGEAWFGRDH